MTRRRKIRRNRHSFSRRRRFHIPWKGLGVVVLLAALCGLGVLTVKWIGNGLSRKDPAPATSTVSEVSAPASTTAAVTTTTAPATPALPSLAEVHGFYMPQKTLLAKDAREAMVKTAVKAGLNAVVFDLKDETGAVYYASATAGAKKAACVAKTSLSVADLKAFAAFCEKQGVLTIPRLCCFEDPTAARKMDDARVLYAGDASFIWLDNTQARGGKPWLNPYAPEAHAYMQGYVSELVGFGFKDVMLTGVQFPYQTYAASFGSTKFSSLSKLDVLAKFVADTKASAKKVNSDAAVIVCAPGLATFSDSTAVYGGNPLNFGASAVSPLLFPDSLGKKLTVGEETLRNPETDPGKAVELSLKQTKLRVKLIDKQKQPALLPFIQAYDTTDQNVAAELKALRAQNGKTAAFVLYDPDGNYTMKSY